MSALSLRLPKSLHKQVKELAQEEGISMNQFVLLAVAEKVASITLQSCVAVAALF